MLRICRRAAVAAGENFAVVFQTIDHALRGGGNGAGKCIHALELQVRTFGEVFGNAAD